MWSKENVRQIRNLILFAAVVVLCVMYSGQIVRWIFLGIDILEPFAVGGMIAFVLNLPMKFVEERLLGRWKGKAADKLRRPLSLLAAIVFVAVLIVIVVMAVLPQLGRTINDLGQKIPEFFQQVVAWLGDLERQYPQLGQYLGPFLDSGESLEQSWASMDQLAARLRLRQKERPGQRIIDDAVGAAQQRKAALREKAGIPRTGAHEIDHSHYAVPPSASETRSSCARQRASASPCSAGPQTVRRTPPPASPPRKAVSSSFPSHSRAYAPAGA